MKRFETLQRIAARSAPAALVPALLVGCAEPGPGAGGETAAAEEAAAGADAPETAAGAELDSVYATFTRAYAAADVDLLMDSVYARDGFYLPPNAPILEGQENFREQFASFLGPMEERGEAGPRISFEIVDREVSGDLAYDIGIYTLRPADAPADAPGGRGKFIVIWKRNADGAWRIHADGYSGMGD